MTDVILIADDDADIRRFVELNLRTEGFEIVTAADGEEALSLAFERNPSLILLDVMMPKMDGFDVCRQLRSDFRTSATPVIMLTARSLSADKVVGLTAGADDYIIKPFDPLELIARVRSTLRRVREMRSTSPLTGLPGNLRIDVEIRARASKGQAFAVCYADLDNFKAYNDHYGFMRGDAVIRHTAGLIQASAAAVAPDAFVGHIGGDDFIVVCDAEQAEPISEAIIERFDVSVRTLYDEVDASAGGIATVTRTGDRVTYPLLSISIGVSMSLDGAGIEPRALVDAATSMKSLAKQSEGSTLRVDRRRS
ncbi:MAG TPA: response regulator [Actinomycetota bacterium]|nr:response regulator [Actinomycetota bacterium]